MTILSVLSEVGRSVGSLYSRSRGVLSVTVRALALELAPKGDVSMQCAHRTSGRLCSIRMLAI